MDENGVDLLLVSGEENLRYFAGTRSLVTWRSFTRPVFAILDGKGPPTVLTHASLGVATRSEGFCGDVLTYTEITAAPVEKLHRILSKMLGNRGKIGFEGGLEQRIGLPFEDFRKLLSHHNESVFVDASEIIWELRKKKSARETRCMEESGRALSRARQRTLSEVRAGMSERAVARRLSSAVVEEGADEVAFVHVNSGRPHTWYPTDRRLEPGDLVYIDAGAVVKGYCCEFDRLATVGQSTQKQRDLHGLVCSINASMGRLVRNGIRCRDIFAECNRRYAEARLPTARWGRAGHGQGLLATELPSVAAHDYTVLSPGSVVSTEPGIVNKEGVFVWEDVYVITPDGATASLSPEPNELVQIAT